MKTLFRYLKPSRFLVVLTLLLAAVNIGFSLCDPIIFGKLINLAVSVKKSIEHPPRLTFDRYYWGFNWKSPGVIFLLLCSISVAMISRIAKNFQDYFLNV